MNRRKKQIYGAILILSGLALVVDRIASPTGTPATAHASTLPPTGAIVAELPKGANVSVAVTPFPSNLPPVSDQRKLRDVFATTDTIRAAMRRLTTHGGRQGTAAEITAESFRKNRHLTAVMLGEQSTFAIVDHHWLRVGDHMGHCEVTAITGTTASFHCPGGDVTLSVNAAETDPPEGG